MDYLRAQSLGFMDDELVETFVRTGAEMLDFVEAHSDLQFEVAEGFPDYKPELPGGRPAGGRSLNAKPFDMSRLGEWRDRITSFPADFSNVGIDAETRARIHASVDNESGDYCVAGTALIAGLLKGLFDVGVKPRTNARAVELVADAQGITGVRINHEGKDFRVHAKRGVVLATGGFEWDSKLVEAYLRGPMHGAVSPPNNTGDGLRMAMAHGADLANMGEAWWVPIVQLPGDTFQGHPRSRSVRLERTRPRSIIVNQAGKRFLNEAGEYNSMAGPFQYLDPRRRVRERPGMDRLRLTASQALRLPRRGTGRAGPGLVLAVGRPRRTERQDRHRRRRAGPHAGCVERQRRRTSPIPTSAAAQALTTGIGATTRQRPRQARRWVPSTPPRTTRCRCRSAPWAPRAARAPTATAASCTSAARRSRVCTRQATRWQARPARRTAAQVGRSAPQWCSATARGSAAADYLMSSSTWLASSAVRDKPNVRRNVSLRCDGEAKPASAAQRVRSWPASKPEPTIRSRAHC